jgi:hypothetical protein
MPNAAGVSDSLLHVQQRWRRVAVIAAAAAALALFVLLHIRVQDAPVQRRIEVLAHLTALKQIDTRWDAAIFRTRTGSQPPGASGVQESDLRLVERALDLALIHAPSNAVRTSVQDVQKAYRTKGELIGRLQQAAADSRQALEAAMRADAAVTTLVRNAWSEFPQRERLVAAENLVARVLAKAQQYHYSPTPVNRAALATYAADLPRAHSLPPPVETGLARLESDVHQLLLLKPLERELSERVERLDTASRVDELTQTLVHGLDQALADRDFYRVTLAIYTAIVIALMAYFALGYRARMKALAARCARAEEALAELKSPPAERSTADPEHAPLGTDPGNVRFIRRP